MTIASDIEQAAALVGMEMARDAFTALAKANHNVVTRRLSWRGHKVNPSEPTMMLHAALVRVVHEAGVEFPQMVGYRDTRGRLRVAVDEFLWHTGSAPQSGGEAAFGAALYVSAETRTRDMILWAKALQTMS